MDPSRLRVGSLIKLTEYPGYEYIDAKSTATIVELPEALSFAGLGCLLWVSPTSLNDSAKDLHKYPDGTVRVAITCSERDFKVLKY